jgi:hypothetical protein
VAWLSLPSVLTGGRLVLVVERERAQRVAPRQDEHAVGGVYDLVVQGAGDDAQRVVGDVAPGVGVAVVDVAAVKHDRPGDLWQAGVDLAQRDQGADRVDGDLAAGDPRPQRLRELEDLQALAHACLREAAGAARCPFSVRPCSHFRRRHARASSIGVSWERSWLATSASTSSSPSTSVLSPASMARTIAGSSVSDVIAAAL